MHYAYVDQNFKTGLTKLTKNMTYFVRAYAINFAGTSYSQVVEFKPLKNANENINTLIDTDGNVYSIVTVGTQKWIGENLKTTHYRNGKPVKYVNRNLDTWKENWNSLQEGAYQWPNDDPSLSSGGVFYNFYASSEDNFLAPYGWRIAKEEDFKTPDA